MTTMTNPLHRPTKTRRLVSAWTVQGSAGAALERVREFEDTFDQVVLMCGGVEPDGRLPDSWPIAARKQFVTELRKLNVSALLDWGGRWSEELGASFHTARHLESYVQRMVDECEQCGADGVDIDIEGWPATMRNPYTDFIVQLSEALRRRDKTVSVCTFSLSREAKREQGIGFIDPVILTPHVDQFRCMTYDLYCPPSQFVGPTSTAPWGRETMQYMADRVPCEKIIMGLPTYSVDWDIADPTNSRQVNDHKFIAEREAESPIGRGWCYFQDVSLIRYTDVDDHPHLLWVSDARSTKSHLITVDTHDLAGVSFWVLTGDEDLKIWQAVREHFRRI